MRIAVLGTGMVGQTLAGKLAELGHEVVVGTRDVEATMARSEAPMTGAPPFAVWKETHDDVRLATFAEATGGAEIILLATAGQAAADALRAAGAANLAGKVVVDITNPLDFSRGFPPRLSVCNDDSIGEQLQREFPDVRIVKALNTMSAVVMVDPQHVAEGDHDVLLCGDDADAKARVIDLLRDSFGWRRFVDLGDISGSRGMEMYVVLWLRLFQTQQTPTVNIKVVR